VERSNLAKRFFIARWEKERERERERERETERKKGRKKEVSSSLVLEP
jgi:hypothetical protein